MNKVYKKILLATVLGFALTPSKAYANNNIEKSVIKIFTTSNSPNFFSPWKMKNTSSATGSGVVIQGNKILTCAHVIADETFIQVQKNADPRKYIAKVESVSHDADLAILKLEDESFFSDTKSLDLGGLPDLQDNVMVYGYPKGGNKLSITKGVVSRIEITNYSHSGRGLLSVQVDAAINSGNSGGPVIKDDKIVGIAFQSYTNAQNLGYVVPVPVIKHFLTDMKDGKYDGFPKLGVIGWSVTENPALRKYYGIENISGGILINKITEYSPVYGKLQNDDILLKIDDKEIASDGTIPFSQNDRIWFSYLISSKQAGDTVKVEYIRNKKREKTEIKLAYYNEEIKEIDYTIKPSFIMYGGFVFTKLTRNLLEEWGDDWFSKAPFAFIKYSEEGNPESIENAVVIIDYMPDEINVGYSSCYYKIVKSVNGIKVKSLHHFVELLKNIKDDFINIETNQNYNMILSKKDIDKANARISDRYKIPFYSQDIKEAFFSGIPEQIKYNLDSHK